MAPHRIVQGGLPGADNVWRIGHATLYRAYKGFSDLKSVLI